jgi:hypothetical protein
MATAPLSAEFADGFEKHRADLLRHCYRMLGVSRTPRTSFRTPC